MTEMEEDSVIIRLKNICADLETVEVEAVIFFCDMRSSSVIPTFCGTTEVSDMARKSTAGEAFLSEFLRLCQVIHARKKEKILSIEQAATEHTGEGISLEMSVDEVANDDEKSLQPGGESHDRRAAENRGQPSVQGSELSLDGKPPCAQMLCEQDGTKSSIDSVANYNKDTINSEKSIVRTDDVTVKREIISGESDYHVTMSTTENEQNCQVRVKTEPVDPDDIVNFNTSEMTNTSKSDMSLGSQFSPAGNHHTTASTSSVHVPVTQVKTLKLIPRAAPEQGNSRGPVITPVDKNRMLVIHPMYGTTSHSNSPVPTNRVQSIAIKNVIPITSTTTERSEVSPLASSGVPSAASQTSALSQKGSTGQIANEMAENNKRSLIAKPSAVSVEPASKRFKPGTIEGRTTRRTPFRDKMTVSNVGSESEECMEKTGNISANSSQSSNMIDMGPRTRGQSRSVEETESGQNPQRSSASSASKKQRIPSSPSDGASLSPGGADNARAQSRTEQEATSEEDDDDDWQEEEFDKLSSDDDVPVQSYATPRDCCATMEASDPHKMHSPTPGPSSMQKPKFKKVLEQEMKQYEKVNRPNGTKRNTYWGISLFQEWNLETMGTTVDLFNIPVDELVEKLRVFYLEAKPKKKNMPKEPANEYHKSTLRNIRCAINRYLQDIGRPINIVHDKEFRTANRRLNSLLKHQKTSRQSRPSLNIKVIEVGDLQKIATYLESVLTTPDGLRQAVWYILTVHFFHNYGTDFHEHLNINAFSFLADENGEFIYLNQEIEPKNSFGCLTASVTVKRIYASPESIICPVRLLKLLIKNTYADAKKLFNRYVKDVKDNPGICWYSSTPLVSFPSFMADISLGAGTARYSNQCLRATAMHYADSEDKHAIFLTGSRSSQP